MAFDTDASRNGFKRHHDTSAADTALTVSTPAPDRDKPFRLLWVSVKYTATPVQTGITIEIDSGAGAAFDTTILTGTANAQNNLFIPESAFKFLHDDIIKVTAPAAGGAITSSVIICTEEVE